MNLDQIPLKGIKKKRGTNFAFLEFEDEEQKKVFSEIFMTEVVPKQLKYKLKDVNKKMDPKSFKSVKNEEEMKIEEQKKKEQFVPTQEEI